MEPRRASGERAPARRRWWTLRLPALGLALGTLAWLVFLIASPHLSGHGDLWGLGPRVWYGVVILWLTAVGTIALLVAGVLIDVVQAVADHARRGRREPS